MKTLLLFDIDGTLLLGGGIGRDAFEAALIEVFGHGSRWGDTIAHGKTDRQLLREIVAREKERAPTAEEEQALFERYVHHFGASIADDPRFQVLPGVAELLALLSKREEFLLGIGTGNLEETAQLKLERGKLRHYFSFGGYGSDSEHRAELIQKAIKRGSDILGSAPIEVIVIGDARQDVDAGKASGARVIGVATGRESVESLLDFGADHALPDLSDHASFLNLLS